MNQIMALAQLYIHSVAFSQCLQLSEPQFLHLRNEPKADEVSALPYPLGLDTFPCTLLPTSGLSQFTHWPGQKCRRRGAPGNSPPPMTCRTSRTNTHLPHLRWDNSEEQDLCSLPRVPGRTDPQLPTWI